MVEAARRAAPEAPPPDDALRRRVVIEGVQPEIDGGRFPVKRVVGEKVVVEADVFADGHEAVACDLLYRAKDGQEWSRVPMHPLGNDRWQGEFRVEELTTYLYTIEGWVDRFHTWRSDLVKRLEAGQDVSVDLLIGAELVREAASRVPEPESRVLAEAAERLSRPTSRDARVRQALDEDLAAAMRFYADRSDGTRYQRDIEVRVDASKAGFSTWYEMFPRSIWTVDSPGGAEEAPAATFRHVERRLPYLAEMAFDVLYFPPIHPIGRTHRKGKNNALRAGRGDPGSPWAIGSEEGGHKAVDPGLGTLEDFRRLVSKAREHGIDIALDMALQCSPDHPYVSEHPDWFRRRPDGTVQYAENPPKKYEDIYPFDFNTPGWRELWEEMRSIFLFWIEQGVYIFRVDNPHTKPFRFWEWLIASVRRDYPQVIFLSEAFTRPKVMYRLAKAGFTQSYTYFAWRNAKQELTDYFTELTSPPAREFFRPSAWPNTPDILTAQLRTGGRPAFMSRLVLAATLSANYGIYGPAFELMERTPREPGSEEYLNSEKYEVKRWDVRRRNSLRDFVSRVNRARAENPALQSNWRLRFHYADNDQLLCYSKSTDAASADGRNIIICVVNLDPRYVQSGWVQLPLHDWDLRPDEPYTVHDLLTGARYTWQGPVNFVQLNPHEIPAHIFRLERAPAAGR